jgi:ParB-like chromosome segregation protein Spo0J
MAVKKNPRTLETAEPFRSLFPVEPATLALVTESIRERGFEPDKPILMWKDAFGERGRQVVVDGHTRVKAALDLKLPEVWATVRQFKDVDAAITAGIGEQVNRRNLNREQIAAYVVSIMPMLDEVKGGLRTRTAKQLAALMGVSVPTVDRARGVLASGDQGLIDAVKSGEKSLLAAYTEATSGPPPTYDNPGPPPTFSLYAADWTDEEREEAIREARRVAAVPQEVFDDYLANDPSPTREGLFRAAEEAAAREAEAAALAADAEQAEAEIPAETPGWTPPSYGPTDFAGWIESNVRDLERVDRLIVHWGYADADWYGRLHVELDNAIEPLNNAIAVLRDAGGTDAS